MRFLWWCAVVLGVGFVAACTSATDEPAMSEPFDASSSPAGDTRADFEPADPAGRFRGRVTRWDYGYVDHIEDEVHVFFIGGREGPIESDPCAAAHELDVHETGSHLELTVYELEPAHTKGLPANTACEDVGYGWKLSASLDEPLGTRGAFGGRSEVPSTADLLVPTALPAGWEWLYALDGEPGVLLAYGPPDMVRESVQEGSFTVRVEPIRSDLLFVEQVERLEVVDIGVARALSGVEGHGRSVVAFEHGRWQYQIVGGEGVPPELLENFARSFVPVTERSEATFAPGLAQPIDAERRANSGDVVKYLSSDGFRVSAVASLDADLRRVNSETQWDAALTIGRRVIVLFEGGESGSANARCVWDYRAVVDEQDESVGVRVHAQRRVAEGADFNDCEESDEPWALTVVLDQPLGDRELIDQVADAERRSTAIETRRVPTWLPDGWTARTATHILQRQAYTFAAGSVPSEQRMTLVTNPVTSFDRVNHIRQLDGAKDVSVLSEGDGAIVQRDGETTVSIELQGWHYRVIATPDVDRDTILRFLRSLKRPALIDGERSDAFTRELDVADPQPGQEGLSPFT